MIVFSRSAPYRIQLLGGRSDTNVRDSCATKGIHKDARLAMCQHGDEPRSSETAYPLETSVNHVHVAGVEVAEASSDTVYLAKA